jgi:hypothetical protein
MPSWFEHIYMHIDIHTQETLCTRAKKQCVNMHTYIRVRIHTAHT